MNALVIEKEKIKNNIGIIKKRARNSQIYAVLKGNAYGMGIIEVATVLSEEGVTAFAVNDIEEAVLLRENGFTSQDILMLKPTCDTDEIGLIIEHGIIATVGSYDSAVALNGIAEKEKQIINAHVVIDTGMGSFGFMPGETDKIESIYKFMPNIKVCGIYTHFFAAFVSEKKTKEQYEALMSVCAKLKEDGFDAGVVHAENSPALFKYELEGLDAVRIGSALTGRLVVKGKFGLQSVGYLEGNVIDIKWIPEKHTVGYGGAHKTKKSTKVAVISLGYDDGFCMDKARDSYRVRDTVRYMLSELKRCITNYGLYVDINGKKARVLGHVGMLHSMVDITNIDCAIGDRVTVSINPMYVKNSVKRKYI